MKGFDFNTKINEAFGFLTVNYTDRHQMTPKAHFQPVSCLVNTGNIQVDFSSNLIHFPIISVIFLKKYIYSVTALPSNSSHVFLSTGQTTVADLKE